MTADEMIDMMPEYICWIVNKKFLRHKYTDEVRYARIYWGWFYIEYWWFDWWLDSHKLKEFESIDPKHACTKMLLRLLENNYLSDYQLIKDEKNL